MTDPARSGVSVRVVTLGCAKNDVDSEEIAGVLLAAGYSIVGEPSADIEVINTCGFLEAAKEESVGAIRDAVRRKKAGRLQRVIVAGCLSQRLGAELIQLAPGADAYVGVGQMSRFADIVQGTLKGGQPQLEVAPPQHLWADVGTRARSGAPASAYLKLSEGCSHRCTFCTIPSFRGPHKSKPLERIVEEARLLVRRGALELNLIAQDVTQYGYDLYGEFTLPRLLKELNEVEGLKWVRLLYFYPNRLTDDVIEAMATLPKVLPYIDVPLQHVDKEILRAMKRPWDGERYLRLFEKVRKAIPSVAIRTTFIVGFPGEGERHFQSLLDFLNAAELDRVGAFQFSPEPGTPAHELPDQVPSAIKQQRFDRLMTLQQSISHKINAYWMGKPLDVLIESHADGWSVGRSFRDAPEIDGLVFVEGELPLGQFAQVQVVAAEPYDLYARASLPSRSRRTRTSLSPLRVATPAEPK